jgi:predicted RNA-binding protein with PIN domain
MYSRAGEKADDVIVRITKAKGSSCVVVTSDREVRRVVEKFGAVAISAREFTDILRGLETPVVRVNLVGERETNKKGNPHRLSKTERKRREVIRKLWP